MHPTYLEEIARINLSDGTTPVKERQGSLSGPMDRAEVGLMNRIQG